MNKMKKITSIGATVLAIGVISIAGYAGSLYYTSGEALAGVTEENVESVFATEAEKTDELKQESLEAKKENLNNQVKAGTITQEKADTIIKAIEENKEDCDGTGGKRIGRGEGAKFGSNGLGQGLGGSNRGKGIGQGQNQGQGQRGQGGIRLKDGTCNTLVE